MSLRSWWLVTKERFLPARKLLIQEGESLPERMPRRDIVLVREGSEDWCVGMRCPCGCGQLVELPLLPEVQPRWTIQVDTRGRPSLHPSVWLRNGCRSHFFVRKGKIEWV